MKKRINEDKFYEVQKDSSYHARLILINRESGKLNVFVDLKGGTKALIPILSKFLSLTPAVSPIFEKAYEVVDGASAFGITGKSLIPMIKTKIVEELKGSQYKDQKTIGMFFELKKGEEDDIDDFFEGELAVRLTNTKTMLFNILILGLFESDEFRDILRLSLQQISEPDVPEEFATVLSLLERLRNSMSDSNIEEDGCSCPNCVERRRLEDLDTKEANMKTVKHIIEGDNKPED